MDPHLFKAQVRFNGGIRHLFKVRVNITLKDQLNEINQGLNPGDTRRVKDLQYARPSYLQTEKIMLKDNDCVRSMFSKYYQKCMFSIIEMEATLLINLKMYEDRALANFLKYQDGNLKEI